MMEGIDMPVIQRLKNLFGRNVFYVVTPEEMPRVGKMTARQLYATQANLHAVVSFLADSVAQLPLKVYVRDDENSRRRDRDSVAANYCGGRTQIRPHTNSSTR